MQINRAIFGRCVEYASSITDCDFIFTDVFGITGDLKNANTFMICYTSVTKCMRNIALSMTKQIMENELV